MFGSQGQTYPNSGKTAEIPLMYCGKQIVGRLNTGQSTLVKESMWFLNDQAANLGNCLRGWGQLGAGGGGGNLH